MDIRIRAVIETLKLLAWGVFGALSAWAFFALVPIEWVPAIMMIALLGYSVYFMYTMNLSRLKDQEILKKLADNK